MTTRSSIAAAQTFGIAPRKPHRILILPHPISDTTGALDRSVAGMKRFLRDLVELAGQVDCTHAMPVLELEFGDVLTRTTVSTDEAIPCLSIIALLPRSEQLNYQPSGVIQPAPGKAEFFWHADDGRYVVIRNIPVADLPDEPSVMDAIMDTSDEAKAWFASACSNSSGTS